MKKLTPKEFSKIVEKMDVPEPPVFFTSRKVFDKVQEVKNAPWYKKLWWHIKYTIEDFLSGGYND